MFVLIFFTFPFKAKRACLQSQILLLSPWLHDVLVDFLALKNLTDFKVSLTQMSQRLKQILPGFFPLLHGIVRFICDTLSGDRFFCDFSFQYQMILIFFISVIPWFLLSELNSAGLHCWVWPIE